MKTMAQYPGHTQFVCTVNGDNYEEIISYNEIINPIENQEDEYIFCKLKRIITHEEPIITSNSNYKLSWYNVMVEWYTVENTT